MRAEIAAQHRAANHNQRLWPVHSVLYHEHRYSDAIRSAAQNSLKRIHLVNVGHPESSEHGQDDESHASAEVAAVNRDHELEEGRRDDRLSTRIVCAQILADWGSAGSSKVPAQNKQQSGGQHEPGQNPQERVRWSSEQEHRSHNSSRDRDAYQRYENSPRDLQMMPKRPAAECQPCPQRDRVGGVRWDGRDSGKKQCRERDETTTPGDGIEGTAEHRCEKQ